ncbi:type VI secretion system baseplate subunit TssE [Terriglobus saanensis]|nr:type VI secretion system baseplate subunit TssE [Terriglobus saanensis]
MSNTRETIFVQSVLDRLREKTSWPTTRAASLRYLKEAIRRDIEDLLNTRRPPIPEIENYPLANVSVLNMGLQDISQLGSSADGRLEEIQRAVQQCIETFEPRLQNLIVTAKNGSTPRREIWLTIEATIQVQPAAETISFDTMLDLTSGMYSVK